MPSSNVPYQTRKKKTSKKTAQVIKSKGTVTSTLCTNQRKVTLENHYNIVNWYLYCVQLLRFSYGQSIFFFYSASLLSLCFVTALFLVKCDRLHYSGFCDTFMVHLNGKLLTNKKKEKGKIVPHRHRHRTHSGVAISSNRFE